MGILRKKLQEEEALINRSRPLRDNLKINDWVWIQKPTAFVGPKLQASWQGPFQITSRLGKHTYQVKIAPHRENEVHLDQMKPCVTIPNLTRLYPTVYRKGEPLLCTPEANIKKVLETRISDDGLEFLVEWNEVAGGCQKWISAQKLGPALHQAFNLFA